MSEFKDALNAVAANQVLAINGVPAVVVPERAEVVTFEKLLDAPARITRRFKALDVSSLIAYGKAHGNRNGFASAVFHDTERQAFDIVLDNDTVDMGDQFTASWQQHTAEYRPVRSKEFDAWLKLDARWIGQKDLVEFFEDHEDDFVEPTGAEIFQLISNLNLVRNVTVASAVNLQNGTFALQYAQEKGNGSVELPERLVLGLAPFKNGDRYEVQAQLRYRLNDGQVAFQIKLRNPDKVLDTAFEEVAKKIREELPDLQHYTASAW